MDEQNYNSTVNINKMVSKGGYTNIAGNNITQILVSLKANSPEDPLYERLLEDITTLDHLQKCLCEWKELHNLFNRLIIDISPFSKLIERLNISRPSHLPIADLLDNWHRVMLSKQELTEYVHEKITRIESNHKNKVTQEVNKLESDFQGIRSILNNKSMDSFDALYDQKNIIIGSIDMNMYWIDRMLRDTANELQRHSQSVLWGMNS